MTIQTQTVAVTPALAAEWLQRNVCNRPLNRKGIVELVGEMSSGNWTLTHQGIAFDEHGHLLDGQHRLHAIVESGVSVTLLVTRGVERSTFAHIDSGRKRTTGDVVSMRGIENGTLVAAIARSCFVALGSANPPRSLIDALCVAHNATFQRLVPVGRTYSAPVAAAFAKAMILRLHGIQEAAARLTDLNFSGPSDPMKVLAKRLRDFKGTGHSSSVVRYAVTVAALRAVHEGRELHVLRETSTDFDLDVHREARQLVLDDAAGRS